jgi:hypothetical protein
MCRRGRALIGLKRFGAAVVALEHSLALSPGDAGAQQVWCPVWACENRGEIPQRPQDVLIYVAGVAPCRGLP